jgi:hypothetical protein
MPQLNMHPLQPNSFPGSGNPGAKSLRRPEPEKLRKLRQQRDQLYEEARDNPDSDADEMVRALLLSGILSALLRSDRPDKDDKDHEHTEALRRSRDERRQQRVLLGRTPARASAKGVQTRSLTRAGPLVFDGLAHMQPNTLDV